MVGEDQQQHRLLVALVGLVVAAVDLGQQGLKQEGQETPLQHHHLKETTVLQTKQEETAVVVVDLVPQVQVLILELEPLTQLQGFL